MAILVTGGAGYIGSVVVEDLRTQGHDVVVIDNLIYGHRAAVGPDIPFYEGDIGEKKLVQTIIDKHGVDACMHFSAFAYVGESVEKPGKYFENNASQTFRLLDVLVEKGVNLSFPQRVRPTANLNEFRSTRVTHRIQLIHMAGPSLLLNGL